MPVDFYEKISKSKYPYIIAEIGSNHNGDMDLARELINSAQECGCDAVKFQSWTPESLISEGEYKRNQKYNDSPQKHFGSLREMVEKYYLREEQHYELKEYCDQIGIDFCSTPFSPQEVDLLDKLDVPFFKIASMDINNIRLLSHISKLNRPAIMSTGMADFSEIEQAVSVFENSNAELVLLHCVSIYPPKYNHINLNNIRMLNEYFEVPVGFSDHTIGTSIPLAAVALGAKVIEKHFTLNKDLPGWDHEISADPEEMRIIVEESENIANALGSFKRYVYKDELNQREKLRRSIVTKHELKSGHVLDDGDIEFKRPGTGIRPDQYNLILGKKLKINLGKDTVLSWKHIEL